MKTTMTVGKLNMQNPLDVQFVEVVVPDTTVDVFETDSVGLQKAFILNDLQHAIHIAKPYLNGLQRQLATELEEVLDANN